MRTARIESSSREARSPTRTAGSTLSGSRAGFTVGGVTLVPYAQAEVFYDTRFGAWNRQLYQAGVELEITKHWRIEPYYAREEDQRSSTAHVDRVGLVLKNLLVALEEHPSVP